MNMEQVELQSVLKEVMTQGGMPGAGNPIVDSDDPNIEMLVGRGLINLLFMDTPRFARAILTEGGKALLHEVEHGDDAPDPAPKLYRERVEEWEQRRLAAIAKAEADFNDPVFLRETFDLEHQDRVEVKRQLAIARRTQEQLQQVVTAQEAEIARLRTERNRYATALHFMLGFLHEDVENIETARQIITLTRNTVKEAIQGK